MKWVSIAKVGLLLAAALPGAARSQTTTPAMWVAEAERIHGQDAAGALTLVQRAIPQLGGSANLRVRVQAEVIRCWAAIELESDSISAYASELLPEAESLGDPRFVARAQLCRGYSREQRGNVDEAIADYNAALASSERMHNDTLMADALSLRGGARYYRGEMNTAIADLNTAYRTYTALKQEGSQRYTLNTIANLYADPRVAEYDKALEYYRQLLVVNTARNSEREMAVDYFNLGSTLEHQGKLDEALVEYRHGLALDQKRSDADEVAEDRRAIGVTLYKLKRPSDALRELDLALAHVRTTTDEELLSRVRLSRGVALRMLGRTAEAISDLDFARKHFAAANNPRFMEKIEDERAQTLAAMGNWREAYEAGRSQSELQRALSDSSRSEQSSRLRAEFDADKKEAENRALLRDNLASKRIRDLQLAVLALSAVIIGVLLVLAWRQLRDARRLRITAMTDELTQLPNRRHLMLVANEQFRATRARASSLGVLALDIDHFKRINDTYGHPVGDAVLKRVAAAVQATLRAGDHVGRTGGEEFVAVLPGANEGVVHDVANRIREAIERIDFSDIHPDLAVTGSVGASVSHDSDGTFSNLMKRADDSLYVAKDGGRNRVATTAAHG